VLLNLLNTAIFSLIVIGAFLHYRRDLHVRIMVTAFVLDLALLLAVEFSESAVGTALRSVTDAGVEGRLLTWIHVAFAAGGLLFWFLQIYTGRKVLKGRMDLLPRHARGARIFLLLRLGNLVTAWMF